FAFVECKSPVEDAAAHAAVCPRRRKSMVYRRIKSPELPPCFRVHCKSNAPVRYPVKNATGKERRCFLVAASRPHDGGPCETQAADGSGSDWAKRAIAGFSVIAAVGQPFPALRSVPQSVCVRLSVLLGKANPRHEDGGYGTSANTKQPPYVTR